MDSKTTALLAAKAAGITVVDPTMWDPEGRDEDAHRLAEALKMAIWYSQDCVYAGCAKDCEDGFIRTWGEYLVEGRAESSVARRRAITRLAADYGRRMP